MPKDPLGKARVRGISQTIACDIHPLNNLRILNYLTGELGQSEEAKNQWYVHWVNLGFTALEAQLAALMPTLLELAETHRLAKAAVGEVKILVTRELPSRDASPAKAGATEGREAADTLSSFPPPA